MIESCVTSKIVKIIIHQPASNVFSTNRLRTPSVTGPLDWESFATSPVTCLCLCVGHSARVVEAVLRATPTVSTLQLRMKRPDGVDDAAWAEHLNEQVQRSLSAAQKASATPVGAVSRRWSA